MRKITDLSLEKYKEYLYEEEKSTATVNKYINDLNKLKKFADGKELTKTLVISYKEYLQTECCYKTSSINSFLAAANCFFEFMEWFDLRVKTIRVQKQVFTPAAKDLSKEEYKRLVKTAERTGNTRLAMIIQALCAMGIRVSELEFITVKSVKDGVVKVYCKGKERQVLIPKSLQVKILYYIYKNSISHGTVFCTNSGKPVDRSNIWREMKSLCGKADVEDGKVFPHNLRHLFAKTFYHAFKDIAKLADILGHNSIETTRVYVMTTSNEYQKQLDNMDLVINT